MTTASSVHCYFATPQNFQWINDGNGPKTTWPVTYRRNDVSSVTYGPNVPNWHRLVAIGDNATTSLSGDKYSSSWTLGKIEWFCKYNPGYSPGLNQPMPGLSEANYELYEPNVGLLSLVDPDTLSVVTATNKAKMSYINKANSEYTKFQGGVFVGELGETLRMIRNPAKSLRNSVDRYFRTLNSRVRTVKRGLTRSAHREARRKIVSDTWLEYAFGWRPLLSDAKDAAKALASINEQIPPFQVISAFGEDVSLISQSLFTNQIQSAQWFQPRIRKGKVRVIIRGVVDLTPRSRKLFEPELWGFDPMSFVPTAWELVPYSFLVDYFTNVGDVLQAWCGQHFRPRWQSITTRSEVEETYPRVALSNQTDTRVEFVKTPYGHPPFGTFSRTKVVRSPNLNSLVPALVLEIPGMGTKWINLSALLGSRRRTPFY